MSMSTEDYMIQRILQERKVKGSVAHFSSTPGRSNACNLYATAGQRRGVMRGNTGIYWHLGKLEKMTDPYVDFLSCPWLQPGPAEQAHPGVHRRTRAAGNSAATSNNSPRPSKHCRNREQNYPGLRGFLLVGLLMHQARSAVHPSAGLTSNKSDHTPLTAREGHLQSPGAACYSLQTCTVI